MSQTRKKQLILIQLLVLLIVTTISCNKKTNDDENEIVVTPAIVAVKNFYLQKNDSVMAKLDSVFFSIDLNTGVIFNADSLPKGIKVDKLIPVITFANTMTKADLTFKKGNKGDTTVNYLTNSTDSIDFTHPVRLDVTAQDGTNTFSYIIKVNVHNLEPDSLMWTKMSTSSLPSRFENPVAQKTVYKDEKAFTLVEEYNGKYTLSYCKDLNKGEWISEGIEIDFIPELSSFTAGNDTFWILSENNLLYTSTDGLNWIPTNQMWVSILGSYGNSILGIKDIDGTYFHTQYPLTQNIQEYPVEPRFPVFNSSVLGVMENKWASMPFAILACGTTEDGDLSSAVWAYDGNQWAVINEGVLPAVSSPMMGRYVVYRNTPQLFTQREFDVWILFGGTDAEGEVNKNLYMSYDNGVHWTLAPNMMQIPESLVIPSESDLIVVGYDLTADLAEAWNPKESTQTFRGTRSSYTIEGYDITWVCPYIYVFGGYLQDNSLSTEIWRAVLARLEFTPII